MQGLPKKRTPAVQQNIQLFLKLLSFLNIQFLHQMHRSQKTDYLQHMQAAEGSTVDKLEALFALQPPYPLKNQLNKFLKENEQELERDDLTPLFNNYLQNSMNKLKNKTI
jgi:hypothetical protein